MLRLDCPGLQHDKIPRSIRPLAIYACGAKLSPHTQLPIGLIAAYRTPILCPFDLSQSGLQLLYPFLLLLNRLPKTLLRLLPGGNQAVLAVKMRRELLKRGQRGRKGVVRGRDGVSRRKEGVLTSGMVRRITRLTSSPPVVALFGVRSTARGVSSSSLFRFGTPSLPGTANNLSCSVSVRVPWL